MLNSEVKRFILPFSTEKNRDPFGSEVEAAAVFALAEFERNKGGGLIVKQPEEKLIFIAKIGYPLWLFPKNDATFIFDGLNDSSYSVSYADMPSAKAFIESLDADSKPRENYMAFLSNHDKYFQQPMKEKKFTLRSLITDAEFKNELNIYRKQAKEATDQTFANSVLLSPTLEETTISSMLADMETLKSALMEDAQRLPECLRRINKTTSQYITELDYESEAVKEEADAKIRAQQELVDPKITKLNNEYKRRKKKLTESFDRELESLQKLKTKTQKFIESNEERINLYQREAKTQALKKHEIYEKRWKEKSKQTEKELSGLKKELKNIEKNIKNVNKQKMGEISKLNFELDAEVKLARQPLIELEAARDAKMRIFKRETEKLIKLEKPVIEGINKNIKLRETITANFEMLSIRDRQLKSSALFYVQFYIVCYGVRLSKRYIILPPSMISVVDFSAKLKGALGMSKIKNLLTPRFNAITALVNKVQVRTKQNTIFENQLKDLSEKTNLIKTRVFLENAEKGLVYLKHEGWLTDKEQQFLSNRLTYTKAI